MNSMGGFSIVFCKRLPEGIWDDDPWWVFHVEPTQAGAGLCTIDAVPPLYAAVQGAWRPANAKGKKKKKLLTRKPPIFQFSSYKPPFRGIFQL